MEWKVLDTWYADSNSNNIGNANYILNNTTSWVHKNFFCYNSNYSISTLNKSEISQNRASPSFFDQKQNVQYVISTLIFVYIINFYFNAVKLQITTNKLLIISHHSIYFVQIYVGHCWYNCVLIENTWIVFLLLHGKTFLCIYNSMCLYSDFLYISANIW